MKSWVPAIIIFLLILTLGIFIGKSCKDDTPVSQGYEQIKKDIAEINKGMKALQDSISAIDVERIINQEYNTYETIKMDSLIRVDSTWVNAIIRARIERLYQLPGFFQIGIDSARISKYNEDSVSW